MEKKKNLRKEHILNNVERKPVVRAKGGLFLRITVSGDLPVQLPQVCKPRCLPSQPWPEPEPQLSGAGMTVTGHQGDGRTPVSLGLSRK